MSSRRMRPVTNFLLIYSTILVLVLLGLTSVLFVVDDQRTQVAVFALLILFGAGVSTIATILAKRSAAKGSWMDAPVSAAVGNAIVNVAVSAFICLALLVMLLMLQANAWPVRILLGIGAIASAVVVGWHLRRRLKVESLLPFGLSFFIALLAFLFIEVVYFAN